MTAETFTTMLTELYRQQEELTQHQASIDELRQKNINADAEIKSLKLSLADRDEEVKTLCSQAIERRQEKKELRDEIRSLKFQLADNDYSVYSTHEHHRELRDKLNAEIKSLKLQLAEEVAAGVLIVATNNAAVHKDITSLEDIITCLQEEITEHHEKEDKLNAEIKSLKLALNNAEDVKIMETANVFIDDFEWNEETTREKLAKKYGEMSEEVDKWLVERFSIWTPSDM